MSHHKCNSILQNVSINISIVCIGVSPPFVPAMSHLKSANSQSPPFLGNLPPLYWFFVNPPLKVGFFIEPPKYLSFSSLTPSYLLKITKFLDKISWFEFLVMTEKNIFAYKLSLSLNISDFIFCV